MRVKKMCVFQLGFVHDNQKEIFGPLYRLSALHSLHAPFTVNMSFGKRRWAGRVPEIVCVNWRILSFGRRAETELPAGGSILYVAICYLLYWGFAI
jgi:hypothetical protein